MYSYNKEPTITAIERYVVVSAAGRQYDNILWKKPNDSCQRIVNKLTINIYEYILVLVYRTLRIRKCCWMPVRRPIMKKANDSCQRSQQTYYFVSIYNGACITTGTLYQYHSRRSISVGATKIFLGELQPPLFPNNTLASTRNAKTETRGWLRKCPLSRGLNPAEVVVI